MVRPRSLDCSEILNWMGLETDKGLMGLAQNWIEQFGVTETDITQWKTQLKSSDDLLQWCLLTGKIPGDHYLHWAANRFEMPIVKSEFFSAPTDLVFWDLVKNRHNWSQTLMPLAEWEGTLLVACLEPSKELQSQPGIKCVLAMAEDLRTYWQKLHQGDSHSSTEKSEPAPIEQDYNSTADFQVDVPPVEAPPKQIPQVSVDLSEDDSEEDSEDDSEESTGTGFSFDAPQGLDFSETPEAQHLNDEETIPPTELPDGVKIEVSVDDLDLDFSALAQDIQTPPSPKPDMAAPDLTDQAAAHDLSASEMPVPPPLTPPPTATTAAASPSDKKRPAAAETIAQTTNSLFVADFQKCVVPAGTVNKALDQCASYDELAQQALMQVLRTFEYGVILTFQDGKLKPWKWTDQLHVASEKALSPIDLSSPSIFRIVFRSCLPYHGYVVTSPVNDAFFEVFHEGKIPKHVTLLPVLMGNQIGGMLMGLTNNDVDYKMSLKSMEALSKEVSKNLDRLKSGKKAA